MIAAWMLYCALWALWLSLVALVLDRAVLRAGGPTRVVWTLALALSVALPLAGYVRAGHTAEPVLSQPSSVVAGEILASNVFLSAPVGAVRVPVAVPERGPSNASRIRDALPRWNRPLLGTWVVLSTLMLLYGVGGVLHLRRERRRWARRTVDGLPVLISRDIGPAVIGVFRPAIVVPEWVLDLDPYLRTLMLRHELEHQRTSDSRLVALSHSLLVLMPWNPLVWWQLKRLRLAVELDCDRRVLRDVPDLATYGRLLLEVFRSGTRLSVPLAGPAFADQAKELEIRIQMLTRRATAPSKRRAVGWLLAAGAAIALGCAAPTPPRAPQPTRAPEGNSPTWYMRPDSLARYDSMRWSMDALYEAARAGDSLLAHLRKTQWEDSVFAQFSHPPRWEHRDSLWWRRNERDSLFAQLDQRWRADSLLAQFNQDRIRDSIWRQLVHPDRGDSVFPWSQFFSDVDGRGREQSTCTASASTDGTSSVVRLILSDEDAIDIKSLTVRTEPGSRSRTQLETRTMSCEASGAGELRLRGRSAFLGSPITIRAGGPASLVVVTEGGVLLAGPIALTSARRSYDLSWRPSRE